MYHVSNKFLKKPYNLPLKFGYILFSASSSTFCTASGLLSFVSVEPNRTMLSIYRSEPRFKSHTEGTINEKLKNDGKLDVFFFFSAKSDSKLFHPDRQWK